MDEHFRIGWLRSRMAEVRAEVIGAEVAGTIRAQ
jgi:hypothetical protein